MRKMDEMELRINQKGITWSWFFLVLSLFVWGAYNFAKTQEMTLPMVLFTLQFLVYFFVTSVARSNVDDAGGKKQAHPYSAAPPCWPANWPAAHSSRSPRPNNWRWPMIRSD